MNSLIRALSGLVFILLAISGAISATILASPVVYGLSINFLNLASLSGVTQADLMINYKAILYYLVNPANKELDMPFFSMSEGGAVHFAEVKGLILINFILLAVLLLLSILVIRHIRKNNWQLFMPAYFNFSIVLPLIALFFVVVAFDQVFVIFHQVLFNNDLWLFNPLEDPVITVLPQEFFMVLFVLALLFYELVILIIRGIVNWGKK